MYTVTKDTIIGDIINHDRLAAECFFEMGMFCVSCPASIGETVEQACAVHGIDADTMVEKLNSFFATTA